MPGRTIPLPGRTIPLPGRTIPYQIIGGWENLISLFAGAQIMNSLPANNMNINCHSFSLKSILSPQLLVSFRSGTEVILILSNLLTEFNSFYSGTCGQFCL